MATKEVSGVKSLLQEEVICPVCQDIYSDPEKLPKKLSCDHIFCLLCLQKLILSSIDGKLTCPVCRAISPLQESDASQYPTAHQVNRLIDIYHKSLQEDDQGTPAVATETPESPTCSLHSSQPLALFCETCNKTVCRDCALFLCAPNKHNYGFLEEVTKKYKTKLDDILKPLQELQKQVITAATELKKEDRMMKAQKRGKIRKIEASFEIISSKIAEQRKQIIYETQNYYKIPLNHYASKVKKLQEASKNLTTAIQATEELDIVKSLATNTNFLSKQKQNLLALHSRIGNVLCESQQSSEPDMRLEYFPQQIDLKNFLQYVGKDFKCCLSEYEQLKKLRLKQPFQISFELTDLKREAKVKAKLICMHDKSSVPINMTKTPDSNISLSMTPQTRGKHELHILLGDLHICGSPIQAFVIFEPHELPIQKVKLVNLNGVSAIKCTGSHVMASSSLYTLNILKYKNQNLIITKQISYCGINQFTSCNNLVYYSDVLLNRLVMADMKGQILVHTGGKGSAPGKFEYPNGVRISNNQIFVCDTRNGRIQVFDTDLNFLYIIGKKGEGPGQFGNPYDLVFDEDGNMYVVENGNKRVQVLSPQGNHIRFISSFTNPVSPAIYNGHLFLTDSVRNHIQIFTLDGTFVTSFADGNSIECIDIDENGFIYITNNKKTISIY